VYVPPLQPMSTTRSPAGSMSARTADRQLASAGRSE
jgi:hypothetical protein